MKGTNLGEFEELVLLLVVAKPDLAYSVGISKEMEELTNRKVVHSVVHAALSRLLKKGLVDSKMGEATSERGGRRKRMYTVSAAGMRALELAKSHRDELWGIIRQQSILSIQ
ncbi:helix-turn-helix transcriptional regulator [Ekhidna sp.]|uniref:PadR family transcriptional regulator n=1 Tax=Ekhidna sp. TaxID=2608089 RepID=UPI0032EE3E77